MPAEEAAAMVQDGIELFPVAVADSRTLAGAFQLKSAESFSFWDTMLVEAARASGVNRVLSEDMRNDRLVGTLRIQNPFTKGVDLGLE